jgi:hypothetical protein
MKRNQQTPDSGCDRQTDLMTYLYDEASPAERGSFERHLDECHACSIELKAFQRVRQELDVWQLGLMPRMAIAVNRSALDALRELVSLLPVWVRGTTIATAAAALILVALSLAGTRVDWRQGTVSLGTRGRAAQSVDAGSVQLTRAEIETMIAERVAASRVNDERRQAEMRAQISNLSLQLATASQSQTKLASSLVTLRAEHRALVAKGQSTLGEWLFASNGVENEKEK